MKTLIFLTFPCLLMSCNTSGTVSVDGIVAKSGNRVGGKDFIHVKKGATEVILASDNEKSFSDAIDGGKWIGGYWAATELFSTATSGYQAVSNSKTAAGVTNTAAKEATKQAGIQATTDQAKIAAEAALLE